MTNIFASFRSPFRSINVRAMIFFLLLELPISSSDAPTAFYDGNDSEEFLKLCARCKDCLPTVCTPECLELLRKDSAVDYNAVLNPCDPNNLRELQLAQVTVRKFKEKLDSYFQSIVLWALFIPSLCIGIYLIAVGHFDWRTLPIVGSKYHPNPTTGIAYWQYNRMKYVVFKSEISKIAAAANQARKTSFAASEHSSVGSGSSDSEGSEAGDEKEGVVEEREASIRPEMSRLDI